MKPADACIYWYLIPISVIVLIDERLKFLGLKELPVEGSLVYHPNWIDLVIHKNYGIAFDIPFRFEIIALLSAVIGGALLHMVWQQHKTHPGIAFAALVILIGALGNFYDRVVYGFTVDYILIFWRSAINISDLVILSGVVMLLLYSRKTKDKNT